MDDPKKLSNDEINTTLETFEAGDGENSQSFPILIIDDDNWIQRILSHYLQSWGFKTYSAMDAFEGIAYAIKYRPLMIILDILMPEVTGETLLKMLKRIEITMDIPVLIISGNLNKDVLGNTYKEGAMGFISKPFSQQILFEKVRDCLGPSIFNKMKAENPKLSEVEEVNS